MKIKNTIRSFFDVSTPFSRRQYSKWFIITFGLTGVVGFLMEEVTLQSFAVLALVRLVVLTTVFAKRTKHLFGYINKKLNISINLSVVFGYVVVSPLIKIYFVTPLFYRAWEDGVFTSSERFEFLAYLAPSAFLSIIFAMWGFYLLVKKDAKKDS